MKNKKPLIGLTPLYNSDGDYWWMQLTYMHHIEINGGIPVMIQPTDNLDTLEENLKHFDGILLTGGQDVHPAYYGEKVLPVCGTIIKMRDEIDCFIAKRAMELDMPLFGICRGMQVINATLGGALYQDLPSQVGTAVNHRPGLPKPDDTAHTITFKKGNAMAKALGRETFNVNSFHHQAVKIPAPGIEVTACAPDGVAEALVHKEKRFVWGVQWHPERFADNDFLSKTLFTSFINACK